jgi:cytochrome c oxidase subunit 4
MSAPNDSVHAAPPFSLYFKVWGGLLALTALEVCASYLDLRQVQVMTVFFIACAQAAMVLLYSMHLRYEKPVFLYMVLVVLFTYSVFIVLTFTDYWTR